MDIQYLKIGASNLEEITPGSSDAIENQVPLWISISTENRNEIGEVLGGVLHDELAIKHILDPGSSTSIY